jgi:BirA family transcriptional regulator, biotin operon repressor / biotin---[acetyl-CoA-carboxylase] ligase
MQVKPQKSASIRKDILRLLKQDVPHFISGEKMSGKFGISRAGLWKHIEALRKEGYIVESFPRKGYRLMSGPERLTDIDIQDRIKTRFIGRGEIHCFDNVGSTNALACSLASEGASEGTVVAAESQTKGRGRLGRPWESPLGGLYFSVILRPEMRIEEISAMTLVSASAIVCAISEISSANPGIKWPNDIFIGDKKVCGILAETMGQPDRTDFLVIGAGINVNTAREKLPEEATSMKAETGKTTDRAELLCLILENLERYYDIFKSKGFAAFREEVKGMSNVLGKEVRIETNRNTVSGMAIDIDVSGALIVRDHDGKMNSIHSGDVILSKKPE